MLRKPARRLGIVPACKQRQISRWCGGGGAGQNGFKTCIARWRGVPNAYFASFCPAKQLLRSHYSISHWSSARTAKTWEFLLAFVFPPQVLFCTCMKFHSERYSGILEQFKRSMWIAETPTSTEAIPYVSSPFLAWGECGLRRTGPELAHVC